MENDNDQATVGTDGQMQQDIEPLPEALKNQPPCATKDEQPLDPPPGVFREPTSCAPEEQPLEPPPGVFREPTSCAPEEQPLELQEPPHPGPETQPLEQPPECEEQPRVLEEPLFGLALSLVLDRLPEQDVVTAGQVCRLWRQTAQEEDVWRRRRVLNSSGCSWSKLMRVVAFAPANTELELEKLKLRKDKKYHRTVDTLISTRVQVKVKSLHVDAEDLSEALLARLAPHLEILDMDDVSPRHLKVLAGNRAPKLCKMRLSLTSSIKAHAGIKRYDRHFVGCRLPSELTHLRVVRCNESVLQAATQCKRLKTLNVHVTTDSCELEEPVRFTLEYLSIGMRVPNSRTLRALIESSVSSLQYIDIHCASRKLTNGTEYYIPDLDDILGSFDFMHLRQIRLARTCHWCNCSHDDETPSEKWIIETTSIRYRSDRNLLDEDFFS